MDDNNGRIWGYNNWGVNVVDNISLDRTIRYNWGNLMYHTWQTPREKSSPISQ